METNEVKSSGGGFHVHVYSSGNNIAQTITQTIYGNVYHGQTNEPDEMLSDKEIAKALVNIVGKGKAIDCKQKWAGAYWFLRWACNYPVKAQDFCAKINSLHLPDDLEFKCEYNNIRPLSTLSFMNEDARFLDKVRYSRDDEPVFMQMRDVVNALRAELVKTHMKRQ